MVDSLGGGVEEAKLDKSLTRSNSMGISGRDEAGILKGRAREVLLNNGKDGP
jgi:hypothetical protein